MKTRKEILKKINEWLEALLFLLEFPSRLVHCCLGMLIYNFPETERKKGTIDKVFLGMAVVSFSIFLAAVALIVLGHGSYNTWVVAILLDLETVLSLFLAEEEENEETWRKIALIIIGSFTFAMAALIIVFILGLGWAAAHV